MIEVTKAENAAGMNSRLDVGRGDRPTSSFIEEMNHRYPTEPVLDQLLDRRMRRRNEAPMSSPDIQELTTSLRRMFEDRGRTGFEILDARWLTGGASKMQMGFRLVEEAGRGETTPRDLVLRMEPPESLNPSSRLREYQLLKALEGTIPVPRVVDVDAEARWFPDSTLIYEFINGITKPKGAVTGAVTGLGTNFGASVRDRLGHQFVDHLGRIHLFDFSSSDLTAFVVPTVGSDEAARWQLNRALRIWEEDRGEDVTVMEVAANWLKRNLPVLDRVSVVHGDYRSGNFLFDGESYEITAWLDWERAHLGDRHRDLAWCTQSVFGHFSEDGDRYFASGLVDVDEFYERYEQSSGLSVNTEALAFYRILNCFQIAVATLATAYRVVRLAKSHQDILVARTSALAPVAIRDLRILLEEIL